jgi:hypothetical protein
MSLSATVAAPSLQKNERERQTRYGEAARFDITPSIARSITRLSPRKGPMTKSDVCRAALHLYCQANDPQYAIELQEVD